jgi:hypothetical protein
MLIRIVKALPAPLMDGFDVRGLDLEKVYDVARLGKYLVVAGYAILLTVKAADKATPLQRR